MVDKSKTIQQAKLNYTHTALIGPSVPPQVLVNVLDVNDVTPTFPRAYEGPFEVTEGQPGPRVWTLRASDEDSGLNGKVEYSITGGDHQSWSQVVLFRESNVF